MQQGEVQVCPVENATYAPLGTVSTVKSCSVPRRMVAQPIRSSRENKDKEMRMDPLLGMETIITRKKLRSRLGTRASLP